MTTTTDMRNTLIQYLIEFIVVFIANKANISRVDGFFSRLIFLVCSIIAVALFNTVFKLYQQSKMVSRKEKKLSEARTYSMFELAMTRSSVRNFDPDRRIEDSVFKTLQEWCEDPANITGPFGSRITLKVFRADETVNGKVGTYGAIKNASCFVVGLKDDKTSIPDFGYVFEKFVLFCTKQQLGTCWMAATFDFKTVSKELKLGKDKKIFMASPIGYEMNARRSRPDSAKEWAEQASESLLTLLPSKTPLNQPPAMITTATSHDLAKRSKLHIGLPQRQMGNQLK